MYLTTLTSRDHPPKAIHRSLKPHFPSLDGLPVPMNTLPESSSPGARIIGPSARRATGRPYLTQTTHLPTPESSAAPQLTDTSPRLV